MRLFPPRKFCFLSEPDRYGRFGHQTFSLLSSWCLAHRLNSSFLPNQYSYFAQKYNEYVDFSLSDRAVHDKDLVFSRYHRLRGLPPDRNGNTKYILNTDHTLRMLLDELHNISTISGKICIHLPFDQTAGILMQPISTDMHRDLRRIFSPFKPARLSGLGFHIVIHIRRGDVNPHSHPSWYIADYYYANLIESLFRCYGTQIVISLLTQGILDLGSSSLLHQMHSSGKLRINSTPQMWTNDNEILDFSTMLGADLLVAGQSSFSQLAALVTYGKVPVCIVRNKASEIPHPLDIGCMVLAQEELSSVDSSIQLIHSRLASYINLPLES